MENYDGQLHFAIAHMRRVDGALPPHATGRKALDVLADHRVIRCLAISAVPLVHS